MSGTFSPEFQEHLDVLSQSVNTDSVPELVQEVEILIQKLTSLHDGDLERQAAYLKVVRLIEEGKIILSDTTRKYSSPGPIYLEANDRWIFVDKIVSSIPEGSTGDISIGREVQDARYGNGAYVTLIVDHSKMSRWFITNASIREIDKDVPYGSAARVQ